MFDINVRGTFFVSRLCIPFLKKSSNPHILNMSPPLNLDLKWLVPHAAYTMSKMNMTMVALALAEELRQDRRSEERRVGKECRCLGWRSAVNEKSVEGRELQ